MHVAAVRSNRLSIAFTFVMVLLAAQAAFADSLTVFWDPNPNTVAGYYVYRGHQSGSLTERYDAGNSTSFTFSDITPGQLSCVQVSAYVSATAEGPRSTEVCGYSNQFPTLANPGTRTSTAAQSTSLQLVGNDPDGHAISYTSSGLPPGLALMTGTGFISGIPTTSGSYTVTASVSDGVLNSAPQSFTWSVSPAPAADTTAPSITITGPTTASTFVSTNATMSLAGSASDNAGVASVSWVSDRGGSGTASGTTSWGVASVGLQTGTNTITVTALDTAGNRGTDVLTVTYTPPDTTIPAITITGPTTSSTYATVSSALTVSGTASDNVGVTQVSWSNDRGGSGTASGTTSWSAAGIALQSGTNIITVSARDAAANQKTDTITVTYTPPDTTAPTVTIMGPTPAAMYATTSSVLTIGGTSSDDRGVTAVSWSNDRGGTGFTSGTTSWSVASVGLQSGTNIITVTAQDSADNRGTDVLTVTYTPPSDTTVPVVSFTSPTTSTSYATTSGSVALAGTSSDNVGVTQLTWSNDRGGSGTPNGTTSWSVSSVALQSGTNNVTVVAQDAAGNRATALLTITYSVPVSGPAFTLSASAYQSGKWVRVLLDWPAVQGRAVDVYRNGVRVTKTTNDGSFTDAPRASGTLTYQLCVSGTNICSNTVQVTLGN
jgi:Putative Ig domain